jgi:YD repeat-containing protein
VEKGVNTPAFVDYTLDPVGNRTQRVDGLGTHTYQYDKLYRITKADYPGSDVTDYTYDAVGNRKTMVTGVGTTNYAFDAADCLRGRNLTQRKQADNPPRCCVLVWCQGVSDLRRSGRILQPNGAEAPRSSTALSAVRQPHRLRRKPDAACAGVLLHAVPLDYGPTDGQVAAASVHCGRQAVERLARMVV